MATPQTYTPVTTPYFSHLLIDSGLPTSRSVSNTVHWLDFCGQVNVPPNRNSGCNHLFIGELQPEIRVYVSGLLVLYRGLCSCYAGDGHAER